MVSLRAPCETCAAGPSFTVALARVMAMARGATPSTTFREYLNRLLSMGTPFYWSRFDCWSSCFRSLPFFL